MLSSLFSSNRDKIVRLKIKTNIGRGEQSKFLINHRELKLGTFSHLHKEFKSLSQGRICQSWECYKTSMHPGSIAGKAR